MLAEIRILFAVLVMASLAACSMMDGQLSGMVVDAKTKRPVVAVELYPSVVGNGRDGSSGDPVFATTDVDGRFLLKALCLHPDRVIVVSHEAYERQEISPPFAQKCDSESVKSNVLIRLVPKSAK